MCHSHVIHLGIFQVGKATAADSPPPPQKKQLNNLECSNFYALGLTQCSMSFLEQISRYEILNYIGSIVYHSNAIPWREGVGVAMSASTVSDSCYATMFEPVRYHWLFFPPD